MMRVRRHVGPALLWLWTLGVYVFLLSPLVVVAGASFSGPAPELLVAAPNPTHGYVTFPPSNLSLIWYRQIPHSQYQALGLSLGLALATALVAIAIGVPAALGLVRAEFPGKWLISALLRVPLQIPSIVVGISFLKLYYAMDDALGLGLAASVPGLLIAHTFLATPYVIGAVSAVLLRFNQRLEEAALILGANRWRTFRRVTLPVIMPGIYTGALYAFIVSFADVPVSLFLGGTSVSTYPVEIFSSSETDFSPAILASATIVIAFSLLLLLLVQRVLGLEALLRSGNRG